MRRGTADYYFHTDDLYNVVAVTDASGAVVERYEYDDYGRPTVFDAAGNVLPNGTAIGNLVMFQGRLYDPETGYYWYRTRYFDPTTGRFTSRDTIGIWGDPTNLGNGYTFVGNNPWTMVDPYGLAWYDGVVYFAEQTALTIRYLPQGYWDTLKTGEQASSSAGYIDSLTDGLNPFGRGTSMGPQFGQVGAYQTGQAVGGGASFVMNAAMTVSGIRGVISGIQAIQGAGGLIQVGKLLTSTGQTIPVIMVNGQAVVATVDTLAAVGVTGAAATNIIQSVGGGNGGPSACNGGAASKGTGAKFADKAKLNDHFQRHGGDFGAKTAAEYEVQADRFLTSQRGSGVLEKVRPNGDIVRYNSVTEEFGVVTKDNIVRTYYRPDPRVHGEPTNLDYFNKQ